MSSQQLPSPPPSEVSPPSSGGVRRHHTISTASRVSRTGSRLISEEDPSAWAEDEVVDLEWVGGVGAVGEKSSSLHRQASLPTRHGVSRGGFGTHSQRQQGSLTPRTLNSLSAIAGHEGEEEDWERDMRDLRSDDDHSLASSEHHLMDPSSPSFGAAQPPSPPPGAAGVRRHQSLTYPNVAAQRMSGLKRAGTLQAPPIKGHQSQGYSSGRSPSPTNADEDEDEGAEEESYFPANQNQYPTSPMGRSSPWGTPGSGNGEWRAPGGNSGSAVDDVSRALNALEFSQSYQTGNYQQQGQSVHPPRFNPAHPPPQQAPGMRRGSHSGSNTPGTSNPITGPSGRGLHLVTDLDGHTVSPMAQGVVITSPYAPPIGHGSGQAPNNLQSGRGNGGDRQYRDRTLTASGGSSWDQKERVLGERTSNTSLHQHYISAQGGKAGNGVPNVPPIPSQFLNQGQGPRMGPSTAFPVGGGNGQMQSQQGSGYGAGGQRSPGMDNIGSTLDVPTLLATKGYNPVEFEIKPSYARYFVIKSYTEDDVHKSLKYEIWSSTDPGNKRLDKAFKETGARGPIYLFFSVNASGHFCGMAEMLTAVDYTRSSTVWASDKWKGVFKVRWIYVRDIPNNNLRHIRLNNTQERKPVTNSRDTQELLPEAGQEMLRIFHTHPARTSLLQDFAFYELQSLQKVHVQGSSSPVSSHMSSPSLPQGAQSPSMNSQGQGGGQPQHPFAMSNPNALAFAAQQMGMSGMGMGMGMNPMLQMQINMNQPFNPATMQSVMRNPSPGPPVPIGSQQFMGPQF